MLLQNNYQYLDPEDFISVCRKYDWYLVLNNFLTEFSYLSPEEKSQKDNSWLKKRNEFILLISELLREEIISIDNQSSYYFDKERKTIDTIVIHHTGWDSSLPFELINAFQMISLYVPIFSDKRNECYGKPLSSEHFYNNQMVFIGYHYIIYPDGKFINCLDDKYIGWHCGNWEYNCKSIAICFHDNLSEKEPTPKALQTAKDIISNYKNVKILGHREIKESTICPGNKFLIENGWKNKLLK